MLSSKSDYFEDGHQLHQNSFEIEEWSRQSRRGGSSIMTLQLTKSPISASFICQIRHTRRQRKGKILSATTQPYFALPLDIRYAASVDEALRYLLSPGEVEGYTSSSTHRELDIIESLKIETAPTTLVLHLKRFWYSEFTGNCEKITKPCDFYDHLILEKGMMSDAKNANSCQYDLIAVVAHHGKSAEKGHYTCAARYGTGWVHLDDTDVYPVTSQAVMQLPAYLLFYQLCSNPRSVP